MAFLDKILEPPAYGWTKDGKLSKPSKKEIFSHALSRLNVFQDKRNWLTCVFWGATLVLGALFFVHLFFFFHLGYTLLGIFYSMVILGTHGTVWLHRYSTHRAYRFENSFWRFICRNLTIKIIPEETYVISHLVHHAKSEQPGDPYNVHGGFLYCYLSDANHHPINRNLSEKEYLKLKATMNHTGVILNSYSQYKRWGSLCHPFYTALSFILNWAFWYSTFYLLGGHMLATAIFGMSGVWAFGVRTFNYDGHGRGKDQRRDGVDFGRDDYSINQKWPGYVSGEWHNNHHLYPTGARSGFLPYQIDIAWWFIYAWYRMGAIASYNDPKAHFLKNHYEPYLAKKRQNELSVSDATKSNSQEVHPVSS